MDGNKQFAKEMEAKKPTNVATKTPAKTQSKPFVLPKENIGDKTVKGGSKAYKGAEVHKDQWTAKVTPKKHIALPKTPSHTVAQKKIGATKKPTAKTETKSFGQDGVQGMYK